MQSVIYLLNIHIKFMHVYFEKHITIRKPDQEH